MTPTNRISPPPDAEDVNVIALAKGREMYFWFYGNADLDALANSIAQFAARPELSLSWPDATKLIYKSRQTAAALKGGE